MSAIAKKESIVKSVNNTKIGRGIKSQVLSEKLQKIAIEGTKKNAEKLLTEKPKKEKSEKITYLAENVTGKQLQKAKTSVNNEGKQINFSFSSMLKLTLEADRNKNFEFSKSFKNFNLDDLTPKNLLPLRTEHELTFKIKEGKIKTDKQKFSVWLIENLITRFYKNELKKQIDSVL